MKDRFPAGASAKRGPAATPNPSFWFKKISRRRQASSARFPGVEAKRRSRMEDKNFMVCGGGAVLCQKGNLAIDQHRKNFAGLPMIPDEFANPTQFRGLKIPGASVQDFFPAFLLQGGVDEPRGISLRRRFDCFEKAVGKNGCNLFIEGRDEFGDLFWGQGGGSSGRQKSASASRPPEFLSPGLIFSSARAGFRTAPGVPSRVSSF